MITAIGSTWEVLESRGYETSWITIGDRTLKAHGRVVGTVPQPYWITYELTTGDAFVTERLRVTVESPSAEPRELDLRQDNGHWTANGRHLPELDGALDCDLGLSPLTNAMPVLRHRLHQVPGEQEFLMAWVSVPDLTVRPSRQTYTHLAPARVRYSAGDFRSDLTFDRDGVVLEYPGLARRLP
ncbi:putative glycolipid-binding domain-containing protein [Kitasatospora sp. HPMI-4]|uniref:putative glycolipid-binding domain-containing protein n=1 Tax=Kitasatospora sp. HPMI-4 TaxID=3448443 RepID=UPI003F1D4A60